MTIKLTLSIRRRQKHVLIKMNIEGDAHLSASISSCVDPDLTAITKMKSEAGEGNNGTGNSADFFKSENDEALQIKTERMDENSDVPSVAERISSYSESCPVDASFDILDPTVFVKVEDDFVADGCDYTDNSASYLKTEKDWTREIEINRVDAIPMDSFSPKCTDSGLVETNVIIKKEEDLGVEEEESEALVASKFTSFDASKECWEWNDNSSQPAVSCDKSNGNSDSLENNYVPFGGNESTNESLKSATPLDKTSQSSVWGLCEERFKESSTAGVAVELQTSRVCYDNSASKVENMSVALEDVKPDSSDTPFKCFYCPAKFTRKDNLKTHLTTHSEEKRFPCTLCSAKFKRKEHLQYHVNTHTNETLFSCTYCTGKFTRQSSLYRHLLTHSEDKLYPCSYCTAKFRTKSGLETHLSSHIDDRQFACEYCPAKFKRRAHLNIHLKSHTNERQYSCEHCSAKFDRMNNLTVHMRNHTGEKPFSCPECPSKFLRKQELNYHLLIHRKKERSLCEKNPVKFVQENHLPVNLNIPISVGHLSCEHCPAKFYQKKALNLHLTTHDEGRLFCCTQCPLKFKRKDHLKRHLLRCQP